jgi:hypothetical protein
LWNDYLLGAASKVKCFIIDARTKEGYWIRITEINNFRGGWTTVNYIDLEQIVSRKRGLIECFFIEDILGVKKPTDFARMGG